MRQKIGKPFKKMARAYIKRRHRRGFGIHSPFAFMVVNDIIRRRGGYYAYHDLDVLTKGVPSRKRKDIYLLFRLIARFSPSSVGVFCDYADTVAETVRLADSRIAVGSDANGDYSLVYVYGEGILERIKELPPVLLASGLSKEEVAKMRNSPGEGLLFYNDGGVLAFRRKGMQRVEYSCRF